MSTKTREVQLVRRPDGLPKLDDFKLVDAELPDIAHGHLLIEQLYMSVDPAMRPRMTSGYELERVMSGGALGRVVQSMNADFAEGDLVQNQMGFREYAVSDGRGLRKLTPEPGIPVTA